MRYETKPSLIGHKVEISYDPAAPETLTVSYPGYEPFTAKPIRIGEYCDKRPVLPASMQKQKPTNALAADAIPASRKTRRFPTASITFKAAVSSAAKVIWNYIPIDPRTKPPFPSMK